MILLAIAAIAAVALVTLIRTREDKPRRTLAQDWFGDAAVVILIVGGLLYDSTLVGGSRLLQVAILLGVLVSTVGFLAVQRHRSLARHPYLAFIPMMLALYMFVLSGVQAVDPSVFGRLAPVLLWAALGVLLVSGGIRTMVLQRVIVGATCAIGVLLPLMSDAMVHCTVFKCGLFEELLTGPFPSGNYLAQLSALSLLIGVFSFKGTLRWWLVILNVLILVATDSRTCQIAVVVGFVVGWSIRSITITTHRDLPVRTVAAAAWTAAVLFSGLGSFLIYNFSAGDFSNRANIWARGVGALGDHWLTGLGGEAWSVFQDTGALPQLFPHSQYLMMLFWGGVLGIVGYTWIMAASVTAAGRTPAQLPVAASLVTFLLALGLTEAFWNPTAVDGHSFFILLVLSLAFGGRALAAPATVSPETTAVVAVRRRQPVPHRHRAPDVDEEG
ncbi:O-antigen ligase family protein [Nakamurella sp. GG22]